MFHLSFLSVIFTVMLGSVTVFVFAYLSITQKKPYLYGFFAILLCLQAIITGSGIKLYFLHNSIPFNSFYPVYFILAKIGIVGLIFLLPGFSHLLYYGRISISSLCVFGLWTAGAVILTFFSYMLQNNDVVIRIIWIQLLLSHIYFILLSFLFSRRTAFIPDHGNLWCARSLAILAVPLTVHVASIMYLVFSVSFSFICVISLFNARQLGIVTSTTESFELSDSVSRQYSISPREKEIIEWLLQGFSNSEIARNFCISEKTVKNHVWSIYRKLGIKNRMQLFHIMHELSV